MVSEVQYMSDLFKDRVGTFEYNECFVSQHLHFATSWTIVYVDCKLELGYSHT
jgi:hypothetical protein